MALSARPSRLMRMIFVCLLVTTACTTANPASRPTTSASTPQPIPTGSNTVSPTTGDTATTPSTGVAAVAPGAGTFVNPVIDRDFPDPGVLRVGDTYYVYATNGAGANIQAARSKDLVRWDPLVDVLPILPTWAERGFTWAPDVIETNPGSSYVMYFTARHRASGKQCIGVASAATPDGLFDPKGDQPLICQIDEGGSIDPSAFKDDDGQRYVLWKNDGNCCGFDTWLYIQKVAPDGLTLQGAPTRLIDQTLAWEGSLVEAPTMWKHSGMYYLFYSANRYSGLAYAVGYAKAPALLGPYTKPGTPLLTTSQKNGPVFGPGGQTIVVAKDGRTWMLYHSWDPTITYRAMNIDELVWQGDVPVVKGPNRIPEPVP